MLGESNYSGGATGKRETHTHNHNTLRKPISIDKELCCSSTDNNKVTHSHNSDNDFERQNRTSCQLQKLISL